MMKLKLYSNPKFMPDGVRPAEILFPFWGLFPEPDDWADQDRFGKFIKVAHTYFELVSDPAEADVAVLPTDWKRYQRSHTESQARAFIEHVSPSGKPLIVLYAVDETDAVPLPGAIVLRPSFDRSSRRRGEFCQPGFVGDMIANYRGGMPDVRAKGARPSVGFCGFAAPPVRGLNRVRYALRRLVQSNRSRTNWVIFRYQVLDRLRAHIDIDTLFILREAYLGGGMQDPALRARVRQEYADNVFGSDYTMCMRGGGNYSFRFFETLSAGRIPIFIDTDSPLPYPDQIDWSQHMVRVQQHDIDQIGQIVADFHAQLTPARFIEMQHANRRLWEDWLSPHGYFAHLHHIITFATRTNDRTA